jgi:hypothetical protein
VTLICIKILGGLGNQMFQYAFGRSVADKFGTNLVLDLSWFIENKSSTVRNFELNEFKIDYEVYSTQKESNVLFLGLKALNFLYQKIRKQNIQQKHFFIENGLFYNDKISKISPPCYLVGYWQSEKYFSSNRETILNHFKLRNESITDESPYIEDIKNNNSVSVHIRRTDFSQSVHGILSIEYYQKAIKKLLQKTDQPLFFIFSDDIEWAKGQFLPLKNVVFVEKSESYKDLFLMSQCKNNIIANSSFSWWGAWLNQNPDKLVLSPKDWYLNSKTLNNQIDDLIPSTWIKI